MPDTQPQTDPIAANKRKKTAARRVGVGRHCSCGEKRSQALITKTDPVICARCQRTKQGKSTVDQHHIAGKANDDETAATDVNDHRADLSVAQENWEKPILENPDGCPVIAMAARIRGVTDYIIYLLKKLVRWIPAALVALSEYLKAQLGPKWWIGTPLEQYARQQ
jgi:hypothetical protein